MKRLINYEKEGPGVQKDMPQHPRIVVFFQILGRKFWKLIALNLIYCAFLAPVLALCILLFKQFVASSFNLLLLSLCFAPVILLGPVNAAMTRLTRDFSREEPVFLWGDFKETIRKNWKESLVLSTIQFLGMFVILNSGYLYYLNLGQGWFNALGFGACLFFAFIFSSMYYYLYLMQVTLKLSLRKIFKNAFYFVFLCLFKNLLMLILTVALVVGLVFLALLSMQYPQFVLPILFLLVLLIVFSLYFYIISFITFPSIKRYIIDPYYRDNPQETAEGAAAAARRREENGEANPEDETEELPEYVYHNGRMVHRSVFENVEENVFDDDRTL